MEVRQKVDPEHILPVLGDGFYLTALWLCNKKNAEKEERHAGGAHGHQIVAIYVMRLKNTDVKDKRFLSLVWRVGGESAEIFYFTVCPESPVPGCGCVYVCII